MVIILVDLLFLCGSVGGRNEFQMFVAASCVIAVLSGCCRNSLTGFGIIFIVLHSVLYCGIRTVLLFLRAFKCCSNYFPFIWLLVVKVSLIYLHIYKCYNLCGGMNDKWM